MGGRFKREWVYIYLWLIDEAVQQNLTQHCKGKHSNLHIYIHLKDKQMDNPVLKNPPDSVGSSGIIPGAGILHVLWGDYACAPQQLRLGGTTCSFRWARHKRKLLTIVK